MPLRHALLLEQLPAVHTDPFDRMLMRQAVQHSVTRLTPRYPVPVSR